MSGRAGKKAKKSEPLTNKSQPLTTATVETLMGEVINKVMSKMDEKMGALEERLTSKLGSDASCPGSVPGAVEFKKWYDEEIGKRQPSTPVTVAPAPSLGNRGIFSNYQRVVSDKAEYALVAKFADG
jgi:hypothetical protein